MLATTLDRENITVSNSTKGLTAAKCTNNVRYVVVQPIGSDIRVTVDGTAPNPATPVGEVLYEGNQYEVWGSTKIENLQMIREYGVDVNVEVRYEGEPA